MPDGQFNIECKVPRLSHADERELLVKAKSGDERARERLILANVPLVIHMARKYGRKGVFFEDMVMHGIVGLIRAIDRFDCKYDVSVGTYAAHWIKYNFRLAIAKEQAVELPASWTKKLGDMLAAMEKIEKEKGSPATYDEIAEACPFPVTAETVARSMTAACESIDKMKDEVGFEIKAAPSDEFEPDDACVEILKAVAAMKEKWRKCVCLRFGLDGGGERPWDEICKEIGTSRQAAHCIFKRSLRLLKDRFARTGMKCAALACAAMLGLVPDAPAITGTLTHIDLPSATAAELAEGPLPRGRLVQSTADPKVVYIGDGYTVPGISLWNFAALTNPPTSFPHDFAMNHHHVRLDGSYSLNAEAGRLTAWYGTNAVWQIIAASSAADDVLLSVEPEGTNMAFTVASESDDVTVETCSSLEDPVWTAAAFGFERLTPLTVKITVPNPPVGEMQYVRVLTCGGDVGMVVSIPLSVPSLVVGGADVTADKIAAWNEAAESAGEGYLPLAAGPANSVTGTLWVSNSVVIGQGGSSTGFMSASVGGYGNDARGYYSATLGGEGANASGSGSAVVGGSNNDATGTSSAVVGGLANAAGGLYSVAIGGRENVAGGENGIALGYKAKALHANTLVWADQSTEGTTSSAPNQVTLRATGGYRLLGGPVEPEGGINNPPNTTNYYRRPDGGTNTVFFGTNNVMYVYVDGIMALAVGTNGTLGVKREPESGFAIVATGPVKSSSSLTGAIFYDTSGGGSVDPSGISAMGSIGLTGALTATNGESRIILPSATNNLVSGTLWWNVDHVDRMP